ncbi:DUF1800 domain-containing protein [Phycicoccus sonneratiae]|uniref:DUF1800 domain-containing protein n=1 Tax=Phycicoccus sonneratiae TaxID=2807628 RepID=A0ABS2CHY7_9MICO|nr:DUF1800 domain-containing protein [Phycicoccus sonneraticus]MBM6399481.1 DUF1800 domain-containing protein [Phycicoccus sonneraticus]
MSPTLPRRSTAAALLSGVARAVASDPSGRAKDAARRTARATRLPAAERPRAVPPTAVPAAVPGDRAVDAAYRPRAALRLTATPIVSVRRPVGRVATGTTTDATALHLARRASFGATPQLVDEIRARGAAGWVDDQLDPLRLVPDATCDALVTSLFPLLPLATWEVHDRYWPNSTGDLGDEVIQSVLARALWSKRQLLEVMVEFWTNHLVVTAPWGETWDSVHRFHVDVVRKHALGRYADMLVAAAKHPAMLAQLDNESSTKRSPNENFGREVLELHTVGVDGGYAESDIRRSALALTGLSTDDESGEYFYRRIRHHTGALSLLGWSHANTSADGETVAVSYLTHLARHPKTARRIATKLAVRFVSDTPPDSLVTALAAVYTQNDTALAPVLRALFASPEFAASANQKVKRPLERMVSTSRVLGVAPGKNTRNWLGGLAWNARVAGQAPLGWPAPNGYPDVAAAWAGANATLTAWNWAMGQGWTASDATQTDVTYPPLRSLLPATLPSTHGALVDALALRLLQGPLPAAKRDAVCAFLDKTAASPLRSTDAAVGWRLPYVVALLLDTPEFATR